MRPISLLAMLGLFLLLSACSSLTVRNDYDRDYDFSQYKTYRWPADSEIDKNDVLAKNSLVYKRVQAAVDKELQAKCRKTWMPRQRRYWPTFLRVQPQNEIVYKENIAAIDANDMLERIKCSESHWASSPPFSLPAIRMHVYLSKI